MKINYDVTVEKRNKGGKPRSKEVVRILDFIKSVHTNMLFEYESDSECRKRRQSIDVTIRREKLPVRAKVVGNKLYIIRTYDAL